MKKILVTTAICLVGAVSMMAQGRIIFANTSATGIRIYSPSVNGGVPEVLGTGSTADFGIGPGSVRIQLLAGLDISSMAPVLVGSGANWNFVTNTTSGISAAQGTFAGGNPLPLAGYDGSAPIYLQMILSSINGLYSGASDIIQVTPTLSPNAAATLFSSTVAPNTWNPSSQWTGSFTLGTPAPEPTSMALAGLGAASLLIFRRRK